MGFFLGAALSLLESFQRMGREGIGGKSSSQGIPVGISDLMEAASSSGEEAEEVKGNWGEELSQNKEKKCGGGNS